MPTSETGYSSSLRDHLATVGTAPIPTESKDRMANLCRAITQLVVENGSTKAVAAITGRYISHHEIRVVSLTTVDATLVEKIDRCTRLHMAGAAMQHSVYIDCVPSRVPEIVVELWEDAHPQPTKRGIPPKVYVATSLIYIVLHTSYYFPFYLACFSSVMGAPNTV